MAKKVTPEDRLAIRYTLTPRLTKDASKLAYVVQEVDAKENGYKSWINVVDVRSGFSTKRFTHGKEDFSPKWSTSGKFLGFLRKVEGNPQLHVMFADGGEAAQISRLPNGIIDFEWLPNDSGFIIGAMLSPEEREKIENPEEPPNPVLKPVEFKTWEAEREAKNQLKTDPRWVTRTMYRSGTSFLDDKRIQLLLVTIDVGSILTNPIGEIQPKTRIITSQNRDYPVFTVSPDAEWVYVIRRSAEKELFNDPDLSVFIEILKINIKSQEEKVLTKLGGWPGKPDISMDGKWLIVDAHPFEDPVLGSSHIWLVNTDSGERRKITQQELSYHQVRWNENGTEIYAIKPWHGKHHLVRIDLKSGDEEVLFDFERSIMTFDIAEGFIVVDTSSWVDGPADIFVRTPEGKVERISEVNQEFMKEIDIPDLHEIWVERDGKRVQGWLALPPFKNGEPFPVCVEMHGGPAVMWSPHERTMWHEFMTLLNAGYAVVFCNPRGSEGYGTEFKAANKADWGHGPGNDVIAVLEEALKKFSDYLDRDRVVLTGGSYAGYLTAWLVTHDEKDYFKAAVAQRGVYDIPTFYLTTDIPVWFEYYNGGTLWDQYETYLTQSPSMYAKNLSCPLLILHSELDFRVPIPTAEALYFAAKRHGKEVVMLRYPREGHELSRSGEPRHIIDRLRQILSWFDRNLGIERQE